MSDTGTLLAEMTERLLARLFDDAAMRAARSGSWPERAWGAATDQGLPLALVEGEQGFGVPLREALALIPLLGRFAVPIPLAETMMANALLARSGLPVASGALALIPEADGVELRHDSTGWRATGEARRVAWGRNVDGLLVEHDGMLALVTSGFRTIEEGANLASMPRDRISIDGEAEVAPLRDISLLEAGALVRAMAMAGALEALLSLTVAHVSDRRQFGRTLSAFQAVQHMLARLAGEVAAASAAASLAADAFVADAPGLDIAIAAARVRLGDAIGAANGIAHQLHGAIGFTQEHRLHWHSTALWSWRDEFGSATLWTRKLGAAALGQSRETYWPFITSV